MSNFFDWLLFFLASAWPDAFVSVYRFFNPPAVRPRIVEDYYPPAYAPRGGTTLRTWMRAYHPHNRLKDIPVIPGTHNSATRGIVPVARNQHHTVEEQLNFGIRFFDFRVQSPGPGSIFVSHFFPTETELVGHLRTIRNFLGRYPSETVLVHVMHDRLPFGKAHVLDQQASDMLLRLRPAALNFLINDGRLYIPRPGDKLENLNLSAIRGKVVLLSPHNYLVYAGARLPLHRGQPLSEMKLAFHYNDVAWTQLWDAGGLPQCRKRITKYFRQSVQRPRQKLHGFVFDHHPGLFNGTPMNSYNALIGDLTTEITNSPNQFPGIVSVDFATEASVRSLFQRFLPDFLVPH